MTEEGGKGLDLPERVRLNLAGAVAERGVQARVISTQGRESMRPPQGHVIIAAEGDLTYAFSKEIPNAPEQRGEAKKVLKLARDAYTETPEERRRFSAAVGLAERQFELPVPEPDREG